MKGLLKALASLAILIGLAGASIYFVYPGIMLQGLQAAAANAAGLTHRSVDINGYLAHYYEGGQNNSQTLVLLHGLGDDKNTFVTAAQSLSSRYRIILPDLQAHGANAALLGRDHSIQGQVDFVDSLLRTVNANRFVIGGNSMGGHIAAAYAMEHPHRVDGLVLLNASGFQLAEESAYRRYPESVSVTFFEELFAQLFVTQPQYPRPVLQHLANELNAKIPVMNDLVEQAQQGKHSRLNDKLPLVTAASLILWGQGDSLLPVAYAEALNSALPNSTLVVFPNVGHLPQFEAPLEVGQQLQSFLDGIYP
ncbi:alpha/beta fold hydrolase [Arenicella xantha]|uniref:Triacylglycerol lipase n=1 Tax=Arenicella xantha TaxID=644221 RepID=A0A395JKF1_9GAMM|nr:alpha/beta hydrolase [Arenicella xantha]RBP49681.1 triacylglycerol lipase [Arenicella xantha]